MTLWFALSLSILGQHSPLQANSDLLEPVLEARVQKLGKQLRCPVCQGVAIADSPAQMARAQLDRVRELVRQGQTDEQVRAYFVERYGEWVLLEPRAQGFNVLVWIGPLALFAVGAWMILRQFRAPPATHVEAPERAAPPVDTDPYLKRIRDEVQR
ncbi:MAG: cytochrome c-type biogenesis protein CcmH [Myxococcaceae bacterium]